MFFLPWLAIMALDSMERRASRFRATCCWSPALKTPRWSSNIGSFRLRVSEVVTWVNGEVRTGLPGLFWWVEFPCGRILPQFPGGFIGRNLPLGPILALLTVCTGFGGMIGSWFRDTPTERS